MSRPLDLSWRSSWAHHAIIKQISKSIPLTTDPATNGATGPSIGDVGDYSINEDYIRRLDLEIPKSKANHQLKVAIVGAGCAGLFVPMIFNKLSALLEEKQLPHLSVDCEIFEASPEKRLGGRVSTHKFSQCPHDYYDVGAMRFPDVNIMTRYSIRYRSTQLSLTEL